MLGLKKASGETHKTDSEHIMRIYYNTHYKRVFAREEKAHQYLMAQHVVCVCSANRHITMAEIAEAVKEYER